MSYYAQLVTTPSRTINARFRDRLYTCNTRARARAYNEERIKARLFRLIIREKLGDFPGKGEKAEATDNGNERRLNILKMTSIFGLFYSKFAR